MADITLADFWGIDRVAPEMNDGKGTSLVLVRTEKGKKLFQEILSNLKIKVVSYEDGVAGNSAEYKSVVRPSERDVFFDDMNRFSFEELKAKYGTTRPILFRKKVKLFVKKILINAGIFGEVGGLSSDCQGLLFVLQLEDTH